MNYQDTVHYLFSSLPIFQHSGGSAYKPGLQTISELDDFYGNPHRKYRTVHVAGTNGKGSVSHMLAAILQGAGYKTGLFTSPHLVDFRERIKINGEMITEDEVVEFVARSRAIFDKVQPSFFEMTTAMAFDHFARRAVDVAVIETGMGGRLDATNIIRPVMSVITNISMDHTQFLGNNPVAIAAEKAGIIKPGVPVVTGETQPGPAQVFEDAARATGSSIVFADRHARVSRAHHIAEGQEFYIEQNGQEAPIPVVIDLDGDYQQKNVITALIALQCLRHHVGMEIASDTILPSLAHVAQTTGLRGRWQKLREKPFTVCDTAHNTAGWMWIKQQLEQCTYKKLHMVIGLVNDKDVSGILELMPHNAIYYFTKASIPRALDEIELMKKASEYGLKGNTCTNVADAIEAVLCDAATDDMVYIGGSTFVVADALPFFQASRSK
ncbi:MAG: bifunctional folylpolyglutamate synthase/dihydrofolate synthase [Bacteroidales bacterium]|jgi:dihydrofolate synthase/folylpolyglutamate synthase|nr:bifunctional folylpolyglutamate synthase/dihydrofolate synthase [Bacteroidales bacterium]